MKGKITKEDLLNEGRFLERKSSQGNLSHKIFIANNISENETLFRYTNLMRIASIFEKGIFFVSNRSTFSDKREQNRCLTLEEAKHTFRNIGYKNKRINKRLDETYENINNQHISCWTLDQNDSGYVRENFLMWSAYAQRDNLFACRIKSSIRNILDSIINLPADLLISRVEYGKIEDYHSDSFFNRFFRKSVFYEAEKEVRFLFLTNSQDLNLQIEVDKEILIEELTLSPFIRPKDSDFQKEFLIDKWPFLKDKIKRADVAEY